MQCPKHHVNHLEPGCAQASQTYADGPLCSVWVSVHAVHIAGLNAFAVALPSRVEASISDGVACPTRGLLWRPLHWPVGKMYEANIRQRKCITALTLPQRQPHAVESHNGQFVPGMLKLTPAQNMCNVAFGIM